jgi:lauroyl/myristoyl acyltransferase
MTGAPMVPSFCLRQSDGRYAGLGLDPIFVPRTGDREANVQAAMQAFARALEGVVRQYPHLWYNFFPYWDTPDDPDAADGD